MSRKQSVSDVEIINAANSSSNMSVAARKTGLNNTSFIRRAKILGVYKPNQQDPTTKKIPSQAQRTYDLKEILSGKHPHYSTNDLKKRIIREQILKEQCAQCGITDKNITLCLDHIDGNSHNHILSNLRLLCPNCHSQTATFAGRNKRRTKQPTHDIKIVHLIMQGCCTAKILKQLHLTQNGANYKRVDKLREIVDYIKGS